MSEICAKKDVRNIALIGYTPYFYRFFMELEDEGFDVFVVCRDASDAHELREKYGMLSSRVLETVFDIDNNYIDPNSCRESLRCLESENVPRINDIIMMDRILREKSNDFSLNYLEFNHRRLEKFFNDNDITLISSGRDTSLQILSMLVGKKMNIPWVAPVRLRIPVDTIGFTTGHEFNDFVACRDRLAGAREWANEVVKASIEDDHNPALKIAARNFGDVVSLLKPHFQAFLRLVNKSRKDRGNDYSRNTINQIIYMYLRRRFRMVALRVVSPWSKPGDRAFCLYALHTQPESSIDVAGSYYSDQISLIRMISRSLPITHELYVKIHPTDVDGKSLSFYTRIKKIPSVRLIPYEISSRELIDRCSIVFALTGTIGYEAGLLGKPVITFARNYYNDLPSVSFCSDPFHLSSLIERKIEQIEPFEDVKDRITAWLIEYRHRTYDGEYNRGFGQDPTVLKDGDYVVLREAYRSIYDRLTSDG